MMISQMLLCERACSLSGHVSQNRRWWKTGSCFGCTAEPLDLPLYLFPILINGLHTDTKCHKDRGVRVSSLCLRPWYLKKDSVSKWNGSLWSVSLPLVYLFPGLKIQFLLLWLYFSFFLLWYFHCVCLSSVFPLMFSNRFSCEFWIQSIVFVDKLYLSSL